MALLGSGERSAGMLIARGEGERSGRSRRRAASRLCFRDTAGSDDADAGRRGRRGLGLPRRRRAGLVRARDLLAGDPRRDRRCSTWPARTRSRRWPARPLRPGGDRGRRFRRRSGRLPDRDRPPRRRRAARADPRRAGRLAGRRRRRAPARCARVLARRAELPQDGEIFAELARRLGSSLPEGDDLERETAPLVGWPRAGGRTSGASRRPRRPGRATAMVRDAAGRLASAVPLRLGHPAQPPPAGAFPNRCGSTLPADAREARRGERRDVPRSPPKSGNCCCAPGSTARCAPARWCAWQSGRGGSAATLMTEIGETLAVSVRRSR